MEEGLADVEDAPDEPVVIEQRGAVSAAEEEALQISSAVCTSSDTDDERPKDAEQWEDDDESDAAVERIIGEQLEATTSFVDEKMLRFYAATLQFRVWATQGDMRARALAMAILEMYVLPGSKVRSDLRSFFFSFFFFSLRFKMEINMSPPVRKGLILVHAKLAAFYGGVAYRSRPPRLVPDLFERACREVRSQVRVQVETMFDERVKGSESFRAKAEADEETSSTQNQYVAEEEMLIKSKRLLANVAGKTSPDGSSMARKGSSSSSSTIRFEVPKVTNVAEVQSQVDDAISEWLGAGTCTLRKVISLAHEGGTVDRSASKLRSIARIENRVSSWAGSHNRIAEQVDLWSDKETRGGTVGAKKITPRNGVTRNSNSSITPLTHTTTAAEVQVEAATTATATTTVEEFPWWEEWEAKTN